MSHVHSGDFCSTPNRVRVFNFWITLVFSHKMRFAVVFDSEIVFCMKNFSSLYYEI
jgi:hypothetical protein